MTSEHVAVVYKATVEGPTEVFGYCGATLQPWRQDAEGVWRCSCCGTKVKPVT